MPGGDRCRIWEGVLFSTFWILICSCYGLSHLCMRVPRGRLLGSFEHSGVGANSDFCLSASLPRGSLGQRSKVSLIIPLVDTVHFATHREKIRTPDQTSSRSCHKLCRPVLRSSCGIPPSTWVWTLQPSWQSAWQQLLYLLALLDLVHLSLLTLIAACHSDPLDSLCHSFHSV